MSSRTTTLLHLTRVALGLEFLWAFFDKLFGLQFATKSADAWIHGGSPTTGFLKFAARGPFAPFYHGLAGQAWVDWLFMLGLLGIGFALVTGWALRFGASCAVVLFVFMWLALVPPDNNPMIDEHLIYALFLAAVAADPSFATKRWLVFK